MVAKRAMIFLMGIILLWLRPIQASPLGTTAKSDHGWVKEQSPLGGDFYIYAEEFLEFHHKKNICFAKGKVRLKTKDILVFGEEARAFFENDGGRKKLIQLDVKGGVTIKQGFAQLQGETLHYNGRTQEFRLMGEVLWAKTQDYLLRAKGELSYNQKTGLLQAAQEPRLDHNTFILRADKVQAQINTPPLKQTMVSGQRVPSGEKTLNERKTNPFMGHQKDHLGFKEAEQKGFHQEEEIDLFSLVDDLPEKISPPSSSLEILPHGPYVREKKEVPSFSSLEKIGPRKERDFDKYNKISSRKGHSCQSYGGNIPLKAGVGKEGSTPNIPSKNLLGTHHSNIEWVCAWGHVRFTHKTTQGHVVQGRTDRAFYSAKKEKIFLQGRVFIEQGTQQISSSWGMWDLKTKIFTLGQEKPNKVLSPEKRVRMKIDLNLLKPPRLSKS